MTIKQAVLGITVLMLAVGSAFLASGVFRPKQIPRPLARRVYEPAADPPAKDVQTSPDSSGEMRPLGVNWNGIIYQGGRPVGLWGVNGSGDNSKQLETQIRLLLSE